MANGKPSILPAAEIERIRRSTSEGLLGEDTRALLAHIDALTAGAVDAEALGRKVRRVWIEWAKEQPSPKPSWLVPWEGLSEPDRDVDRRIGLALHAIGYAAGAVAMTGEDDPATEGAILILMKRHDDELREAHAAGRSEGEARCADLPLPSDMFWPCMCHAHSGGDDPGCSECHPPTARELQRRYEVALSVRDGEVARLTAELAEARSATFEHSAAETDKRVAAAHAEGAREEREACARIAEEGVRRDLPHSIVAAIRARSEGSPK